MLEYVYYVSAFLRILPFFYLYIQPVILIPASDEINMMMHFSLLAPSMYNKLPSGYHRPLHRLPVPSESPPNKKSSENSPPPKTSSLCVLCVTQWTVSSLG